MHLDDDHGQSDGEHLDADQDDEERRLGIEERTVREARIGRSVPSDAVENSRHNANETVGLQGVEREEVRKADRDDEQEHLDA